MQINQIKHYPGGQHTLKALMRLKYVGCHLTNLNKIHYAVHFEQTSTIMRNFILLASLRAKISILDHVIYSSVHPHWQQRESTEE